MREGLQTSNHELTDLQNEYEQVRQNLNQTNDENRQLNLRIQQLNEERDALLDDQVELNELRDELVQMVNKITPVIYLFLLLYKMNLNLKYRKMNARN